MFVKHLVRATSLGFVLTVLCAAKAEAAGGGQAGAFLRIPLGARAAGLGNAFCAVANDAASQYFNPASLGMMNASGHLGTGYSLMTMDRAHAYGNLAFSRRDHWAAGLLWKGFRVSDIDGRDRQGNPTGKFDDSEMLFALGVGGSYRQVVSVGMNVKYIHHSLAGKSGTAVGVDVGGMGSLPIHEDHDAHLNLGVSLSNIASRLAWNTSGSRKEEIPTTLRIGLAGEARLNNWRTLVATEVESTEDESASFHLGVELGYGTALAIRCGADDRNLVAGFSVGTKTIRADFAYQPDVLNEGATLTVGLQVSW